MKLQRLPLASQHQETSGRERKEQNLPLIPNLKCPLLLQAIQSLRGDALIVAATVASELGDIRRFEQPTVSS